MKCLYCKGVMVRATAPFQVVRKGYHLTLDAVPAWVCNQCGEAYFEEEQVDHIQGIITAVDEKACAMTAST